MSEKSPISEIGKWLGIIVVFGFSAVFFFELGGMPPDVAVDLIDLLPLESELSAGQTIGTGGALITLLAALFKGFKSGR